MERAPTLTHVVTTLAALGTVQVAGLSAHLTRPNQPLPEFDDVSPRIEELERSIAGNRESIFEAAREAAEAARKEKA